MNGLIFGLLIFQLVYSLNVVFPGMWEKIVNAVVDWHKYCFEPMNLEERR